MYLPGPVTSLQRHFQMPIGRQQLSKFGQMITSGHDLMVGYVEFLEAKKKEEFKITRCQPDSGKSIDCGEFYSIFEGTLVSNPRFHKKNSSSQNNNDHQDSSEEIWASWCGLNELPIEDPRQFSYPTNLYFRRVWPSLGSVIEIAEPEGHLCGQNAIFFSDDDTLYMVYERAGFQGLKDGAFAGTAGPHSARGLFEWQVYARTLDTKAGLVGDEIRLSSPLPTAYSRMARRPQLMALKNGQLIVGWDEWSAKQDKRNSNQTPFYQLAMSVVTRDGNQLSPGPVHYLEAPYGSTIQQGIKFLPTSNSVLAFFYWNTDQVLKHWSCRELKINKSNEIEQSKDCPYYDQFRFSDKASENQGAEFPNPIGIINDQLWILSRPSHGRFLHTSLQDKGQTLSLDEDGWGARDFYAEGLWLDDHLYILRRGAKDLWLEGFSVMAPKEEGKESKQPGLKETDLDKKNLNIKSSPLPSFPGVLFGDVHMHSAYSDGTGTPDEIYARAFQRGLDFAMLTDHDNIVGSRLFPSQYYEIMLITDFFDQLPQFTTIQAYEWTTPPIPKGFGHKNVYFKKRAPIPIYSFKHEFETTPKLYEALNTLGRKKEVFTAPHHTAWTGTDWENFDPQIQRHFEIASVHGIFEDKNDNPLKAYTRGDMDGMFARDGLKKELPFGFIAGSDGHGLLSHHGHGRHDFPWDQGLTGVYSQGNSRSQVFQALYDQKTLASTGTRASFQSWSVPNFKNISPSKKSKRKANQSYSLSEKKIKKILAQLQFHTRIEAEAEIKELILVVSGSLVWKSNRPFKAWQKHEVAVSWSEIPTSEQEHLMAHALQEKGLNFYFRAIVQKDNSDQIDMLFTSPQFWKF